MRGYKGWASWSGGIRVGGVDIENMMNDIEHMDWELMRNTVMAGVYACIGFDSSLYFARQIAHL